MSMQLARLPRQVFTPFATPLEPLERLTKALGGPEIWIKRDDMTGLAGGGNKTRKLEFLVADAIAKGANTLITVGAPQSNHCRITAAAAARMGLKCRIVIEERVPGSFDVHGTGNHLLFGLLGAGDLKVVPAGTDLAGALDQVADEVRADGGVPYIIPGGGSNPLGSMGYVVCAQELLSQCFERAVAFDRVVCASGSAGTHAGLMAGLALSHAAVRLTGISVRRPRAEQCALVAPLAAAAAQLAGCDRLIGPDDIEVHDDWVGPGYSLPTPEMVEAVEMLARLEGILLDPVYTGKAMAGLIGLVRAGEIVSGERVVFIHTGGSPALFAYRDLFS